MSQRRVLGVSISYLNRRIRQSVSQLNRNENDYVEPEIVMQVQENNGVLEVIEEDELQDGVIIDRIDPDPDFIDDENDDIFNDDNSVSSYEDEDNDSDNEDMEPNLQTDLSVWCIKYHISHRAFNALLRILIFYFPNSGLPLDSRSLLHTPNLRIQTRPCETGEFYYYGIQRYLELCEFPFLEQIDRVELNIGWDGISLSDSSNLKLWPIMGSFVKEFKQISPFVIAAFFSKQVPVNPDFHFEEFANEINHLTINGCYVTPRRIFKPFSIRAFICDSEAASILTGRKTWASTHGCPKCTQVGLVENHRIIYSNVRHEPRTDLSFRNREDIGHHRESFQDRLSILEQTNLIGMVSQFPLDPMHALPRSTKVVGKLYIDIKLQ